MRRKVVTILVAVAVSVVCVSSVLGTQGAGGPPKKATPPMWATQPEYVPGELLVKFRDGTTTKSIRGIHATVGARVAKHFSFIGVDHVKLPEGIQVTDALATYKALPNVEYAEPNYYLYAQSLPPDPVIPSDPRFSDQWGLHNTGQTIQGTVGTADADIDAPEAWRYPTAGEEVVVAVLDSGVGWFHPDLGAELIWQNPNEIWNDGLDNDGNGFVDDTYGWDFVDADCSPLDQQVHGSHVAGIIGAVHNNSFGVAGAAPGVKVLPVRVLDTFGRLTVADEMLPISYVIDLKDRGHPISVANVSYGGPNSSSSQESAFAQLRDAGILVCASAGNNATDNDADPSNSNYPSSYDLDNIMAVGASNSRDDFAEFSHWGATSVDLVAPGWAILSSVPYRVGYRESFDDPFDDWVQIGWPQLWGIENVLGDNMLSDSFLIPYFNNSDTIAYKSYPLDISNIVGFQIRFEATYILEWLYDYVTLVVSSGGPFAPCLLYERIGPRALDPVPGISGIGGAVIFESDVLENCGAADLLVGFNLISDSINVFGGIYVDDLEVRVFPNAGAFNGTEFRYEPGTSMACPMVAGAAAFLKMVEPGLDYAQIKALILDNVDPMTMPVGKATVTNGRLNLHSAARMIDYDEDGMILEDEHNHDCDPHDDDSDDDYVLDGDELDLGTNPTDDDTDDDGLIDGAELFLGTNPLDPDSDDDGYSDGVEVDYGSNPNDANDVPSCTLTVASSNPSSGVSITVSPADNNGHSSGTTQFTRVYDLGASVILTAPATAGDNDFEKWQRNGSDYSTGREVGVTMNTNYTMTAVYSLPSYAVYAPWYYESVSDAVGDGGGLVDGVLSFVSVRNAADVANTLQITYLSGGGDAEGPYEVVVSAGEAIAWSPYSDTGGAEMAGIPNASFAPGSVKIESTQPVVGRVIQVEVSEGTFISMATQPLVEESASNEVYAPWYYESVSDAVGEGGGLVDSVLSFVSVRNAADMANTLQITYLSGAGDAEGPYEVVVSAGEAVAWSPYSDTGGAEMAGIPNASFAAGSVKIESTHPVVGRVIQVEVGEGAFVSMGAQPLVEESASNEVYAPWYYESVSDAVGDEGELVDGVLSFVSVRNATDAENTLQITYLSGAGVEEGPYEVVVSAGEAVAWSPYSDAGGAEMAGIPNASFAAGSVKIESTHPVVGRVIQVEVREGAFISMASQPLVEKTASSSQ